MYMANSNILRPTQPILPLAHVGVLRLGNTNFMFSVGGNTNFSIFRYHHVGIHYSKFRVRGIVQRKHPTQEVLHCSGI